MQLAELESLEDSALMACVARQDRAALGVLVARHQQRVLELALRFTGRLDVAEDVCQDAFLRVWQAAAGYEPTARFSTWLYRIVANLCWDHRRRAARRNLPLNEDPAVDPGPQAAIQHHERQLRIRAAVQRLPDRQRLVLILHRFAGLSHEDIIAVTGWTRRAVESCLVRAYDALRQSLSELRDEA